MSKFSRKKGLIWKQQTIGILPIGATMHFNAINYFGDLNIANICIRLRTLKTDTN